LINFVLDAMIQKQPLKGPQSPISGFVVATLMGAFLTIWSLMICFERGFWWGVQWKGGIRITPEVHPVAFWTTVSVTALVGLALIVSPVFHFLRSRRKGAE
jgi:hypothetical protein